MNTIEAPSGGGGDLSVDDPGGSAEMSHATRHGKHVVHLPSPRAFLRHATVPVIEGVLGPAVLFYLVLTLSGFHGALIAAMGWSCLAAARRISRRERLPALVLLGLVLLGARTIIAYATGSAVAYFIQPALGTALVAVLLLGSAIARRPLIERLAHDFCPLDAELMARPFVRQFFLRLSIMWCAVMMVNAATALVLLLESSLRTFLVERTVVSTSLTAAGIAISTLWFVGVMQRAGLVVRFGGATLPEPARTPRQ